MSFFTHDQIVKTITFLYPNLKSNWDYRSVMSVADSPKFIPLSDGWIEAWTVEGIEQPPIEYLKQVYADNNLDNWSAVTQQPSVQGAQTL